MASKLRINQFDSAGVTVLNKWATEHTNTLDSHTRQLNDMKTLLQKMADKNPDLVKP